MSSQGPAITGATGTVATPPFAVGPTGGTPLELKGYAFSKADIRDGSDWTAYRRQSIMFREKAKSQITQDQWAQYGNDYRIQWLLGKYKTVGGPVGCTGCSSNAFSGTGPNM